MPEAVSHLLGPWANLYVITGSASASLTGLMFVTITLVSGVERLRRAPDGVKTFSTPTVVHFCVALFVSVVLSAPWHAYAQITVVLGLGGAYGVSYVLYVMRRMGRTTTYDPDAEDWTWYFGLPLVAYAAIITCALLLLTRATTTAMFGLAAATTLLIFVGIHNAWDVVTFIAVGDAERAAAPPEMNAP
jgi:hypothetical protein